MPQIIQLSLFDGKICYICQELKPLADFAMARKHTDGKASYCRACQKKKSREFYLANKERINARNIATYRANIEHYREANRQWYAQHRETQLLRFREYRRANPEYFREYGRTYYEANKERLKARFRAAYAQRDKDQERAYRREWRKSNRSACRALWQRRRARIKAAPGCYTAEQWSMLLEWFGGVCLCCGSHDDITIDHVVPLVYGGANSIENLQPLCRSCNSKKHDKIADYRDQVSLKAFFETLN